VRADPPVLHGSYLHWTRTVAGKTVTRTLTQDQARCHQAWLDDARRLRDLLSDLEAGLYARLKTPKGDLKDRDIAEEMCATSVQ
jgi:hypothetical protein